MNGLKRVYSGANSYLQYDLTPEDVLDTVSLAMLTHTHIDGIIPTQFRQMDEQKQLLFNVSGKASAADFFSVEISKAVLIRVLRGIAVSLISAKEYRLPLPSIMLTAEGLFVDRRTGDPELLCIPLKNTLDQTADPQKFFKELVFNAKLNHASGYDHIAQIMHYLNANACFDLKAFRDFLDHMDAEPSAVQSRQSEISSVAVSPSKDISTRNVLSKETSSTVPIPDPPADDPEIPETPDGDESDRISLFYLLQHYNSDNAKKYKEQCERDKQKKGKEKVKEKSKEKPLPSDFGFDFDYPGHEDAPVVQAPPKETPQMPVNTPVEHIDYGSTILLNTGDKAKDILKICPYLIWQRTSERISIDSSPFQIGRKQSDVNFCITNNKTVGRVHAQIICDGEKYYVRDLESANHTYLNGKEIPAMTDVELFHGCKIIFSDEEFEFRLG